MTNPNPTEVLLHAEVTVYVDARVEGWSPDIRERVKKAMALRDLRDIGGAVYATQLIHDAFVGGVVEVRDMEIGLVGCERAHQDIHIEPYEVALLEPEHITVHVFDKETKLAL